MMRQYGEEAYELKKLEFELPQAICKFNCMFCSNYGGTPIEAPISKELCFKLVDEFQECGGELLVLTGGEPLECPFCLQLMKYAHSKGVRLYLYTSGYPIADKPYLVSEIKELSVEKVYLTVLGSKDTHNLITQVENSYDKTMKAVALLSREGVYVGINFVAMKVNWREWMVVAKSIAEAGAKEFRITEFMPQGRGWENRKRLDLSLDEYFEMLKEMRQHVPTLRREYGIKLSTEGICFGFLLDPKIFPSPTCSAGKWGLTVTPEGYIIPCLGARVEPGSRKPKYILGKYTQRGVLKCVWSHSEILKYFRRFSEKDLKGKCMSCPFLSKCKGGCPIRREIATGDLNAGPDYKCIVDLVLTGE